MLDPAVRCDPATMNYTRKAAFGPSDLDKMFERVLNPSSEWQAFEPRAVSEPPARSASSICAAVRVHLTSVGGHRAPKFKLDGRTW